MARFIILVEALVHLAETLERLITVDTEFLRVLASLLP